MSKRVLTLLANGFEETEYVGTRDALIRSGLDVDAVSLEEGLEIRSNHNLLIKADILFENLNLNDYDVLFIPGGPGTEALGEKEAFDTILDHFVEQNKIISAICAAPTLLAKRGLLKDHEAVCYPEEELINVLITNGAKYLKQTDYVASGNYFTGKNYRVSIEFGLELAKFIDKK